MHFGKEDKAKAKQFLSEAGVILPLAWQIEEPKEALKLLANHIADPSVALAVMALARSMRHVFVGKKWKTSVTNNEAPLPEKPRLTLISPPSTKP